MKLGKFNFFSLLGGVSVMDRYIAAQLIPPFLFGMGAFSSTGVAIGSLFDVVRKAVEVGIPLAIVAKVLVLKMPQFIAYAFPTSVLLATLMTYSRLSSDSELVALRSCGVSIYRMVFPAIVLSLVVTGMTFAFNEYVVPAANYESTRTLNAALKEDKPSFQDSNIFYPEYEEITHPDGKKERVLKRLFYANKYDGQQMKGLTILDWSKNNINQILTSESAVWNPGQNTWDFFKGAIYLIAPDATYRNIVRFEHQQLQLPRAPLSLAEQGPDYNEMNIAQAQERLKTIRLSGDEQKIRKLIIRIHQKIALPFACVVFGLVGSALANRPQRTTKATGFGISVLVIFIYYLMMSFGDALGLSNFLSPIISAWLPNLFGLGSGIFLLVRSAK
jgi:lipopolysaccharide export system permease protein